MKKQRWCTYIAFKWRYPKIMWVFIALEIPLVVAVLALFGIADPDTYRTKLWQNGSDQGFNSNPNEILYDYANYRPVIYPLVWSQFTTNYNVYISVFCVFMLLVKTMMFVMDVFVPVFSVFVHAVLLAIFAISIRNQGSPDLTNTNVPHLSKNLAWFIEKGCSYATQGNWTYCMQARTAFIVTILLEVLFVFMFALSIYSSIPTRAELSARKEAYDDEIELRQARLTMDPDAGLSKEEKWERNRQMFLNLPKTPNTPGFGQGAYAMTPRTTAFGRLTGETSSARPQGGKLAFRERWDEYGEVRVPDPI